MALKSYPGIDMTDVGVDPYHPGDFETKDMGVDSYHPGFETKDMGVDSYPGFETKDMGVDPFHGLETIDMGVDPTTEKEHPQFTTQETYNGNELEEKKKKGTKDYTQGYFGKFGSEGLVKEYDFNDDYLRPPPPDLYSNHGGKQIKKRSKRRHASKKRRVSGKRRVSSKRRHVSKKRRRVSKK
jgi:hypothetical protein